MKRNYLLVALGAVLLISSSTLAVAYTESTIYRPNNGNQVTDATTDTPLYQIEEDGPYTRGTTNQQLVNITNNYDETISTTIRLSPDSWALQSGGRTTTLTLQPNETKPVNVTIPGQSTNTCTGTNQTTMQYTYSVDGGSITIEDSTNTVIVCGTTQPTNTTPPTITTLQNFTAVEETNTFTLETVTAEATPPANLTTLTYEITNQNTGQIVYTQTEQLTTQQYQ